MKRRSAHRPEPGTPTASAGAATAVVLLATATAFSAVHRSWLADRVVPPGQTAPPWLGTALELVAQGGLLSLVVLCAALAWRAQRRGPHELGRIAAAGAGAVLAYVASELLKVLAAQSRPCAGDVDALLTCPALSDYSWPSNHATIAGALATAAILAARRLAPLVVPVAVAVAAARVFSGVHYLHDVTAGLLLGAAVVLLATALLAPITERASQRLDGVPRGRRDTPELTRQPIHHTTRK